MNIPPLPESSDNLLQSFFNLENDLGQAFTFSDAEINDLGDAFPSGESNAGEVNDPQIRHDVGGQFSELVVFPLEVNDPTLQFEPITPNELTPPKRGRPPKVKIAEFVTYKKPKKYEQPPTSKSVRNAIGAKRNRDLKKEIMSKMQSQLESLKDQNLSLTNQVVALLVEKENAATKISKLSEQNENYRKRFELILKNALFGGEKVDGVEGSNSLLFEDSSQEKFHGDDGGTTSPDFESSVDYTFNSENEGPDSLPELDQLLGLDQILYSESDHSDLKGAP